MPIAQLEPLIAPGLTLEDAIADVRAAAALRLERSRLAVELIEQRFPEARSAVTSQGERALAGQLVLPGTGGKPAFVGDPPDWFANPNGDSEYLWLLNRMPQWEDLRRAWLLTGDERFRGAIIAQMLDWVARCPSPDLSRPFSDIHPIATGVHPWRALEVGIRMFSHWRRAFDVILAGGPVERATESALLLCLHRHGEFLALIPPQLWPKADHNHFLMESPGAAECRPTGAGLRRIAALAGRGAA
ncbi:MAG: hypothetical protein H0V44_15080 [Planctomycetes bacterium]|nr:hypothetical protein [Planctomycetota bacterium]